MADLQCWVCDQGVGVIDSERACEFAGEGAGVVVAVGIVACVVGGCVAFQSFVGLARSFDDAG